MIQHLAIIMDGNGRWAKARGLARSEGHRAGSERVREVLNYCKDVGIKYLTLYAFSVENWTRPKDEVATLMSLLSMYLVNELPLFHENRIRLRVMGRMSDLPGNVQMALTHVMDETKDYDQHLILCLSYGGRTEIASAAKQIAERVVRGELTVDAINEETVAQHLYLPDVPDPELIVRTSGELRLSNFLLWQASYAEFYSTPVCWPDFDRAEFDKAIAAFGKRERRFGGVEAVK
ncbi:MAG: polyprenyl diphosphate synthase [bacterium]|nr:polyprenyl diphosphate synthase [bacterium]